MHQQSARRKFISDAHCEQQAHHNAELWTATDSRSHRGDEVPRVIMSVMYGHSHRASLIR
eukprot:SAG31_NODE_536_length_14340_cov_9.449196_3_plen_60_part_00